MKKVLAPIFWFLLALLGAGAYAITGVSAERTGQFRLYSHRGGLHLRHRLPVLLQMDCRARARAQRPPRHAVRSSRRRPGFREDEQMDCLRPSFRGDCRAGTARRAGARRAIRLSAGNAVDSHRRRARRRGAGFRHFVLLDAAGRQIARPDGEGGIEFAGRLHRGAGDSGHSGDYARGPRARRCQGPRGKSVGHFHRGRDHSHRAVDGLLHALCARRKDFGSLSLRRYAAAARGVGRQAGLPKSALVAVLRPARHYARLDHHWLWLSSPAACRCGCCSRRAIISARS